MQIELAEQKAETVRVLRLLNRILPLDAKLVRADVDHGTGEKAARMGKIESPDQARILARDHLDLLRSWRERAHDGHRADAVRTEDREGIPVAPVHQRLHRLGADPDEAILADRHALRAPLLRRLATAAKPRSGMASQSGRLAAS